MKNCNRKKILKFFVFIAVFFMGMFSFTSQSEAFCLFCSGDSETYKMEKQFRERIEILKSIFGNSIDEITLAATVLHKEGGFAAISSRYDSSLSDEDLQAQYNEDFDGVTDNANSYSGQTLNERNIDGEQIDLLNAAAIIMADSAGWTGTYDEDKYKEALAGDKLVGNNGDNEVLNTIYNNIFCGVGFVGDTIFSWANITYQFMTGQDVLTEAERTSKRFYNMTNICAKGYIGAVYNASEIENDTQRQAYKDEIAQEIIDLANYYKEISGSDGSNNNCVDVSTSSANYSSWKQTDSSWNTVKIGSSNLGSSGCLITSIAIQMARSGTQITNLPSGYSSFNPGALATVIQKNNGFDSSGNFQWTGYESIAANWKIGDQKQVNIKSTSKLAKVLSEELSTAAEGKYQKFIVLQLKHKGSNEHWVAVDTVSDNSVTIYDPGKSGTTLDDNYDNWVVTAYQVMYATDIKTGSTTSDASSAGNYCSGSGTLEDFANYLAYVEGTATCNYKGQGKGTGYATEVLNDGQGATTAFGITKGEASEAKEVGYTNFLSDLNSGCTSKEYIDKMFPKVIQRYLNTTSDLCDELNLNTNECYALTGIAYGGDAYLTVANKIRKYGKTSYEVFHCFVTLGCGFTNSSYLDGLARRRAAEYEMFRTGNYNVKKPTETYAYFATINTEAKLEKYMDTHWPSNEKIKS